MSSRRAFLASLAGAALAPKGAHATGKLKFSGPYGLELYSLRKQIGQDLPGTLAKVREAGYTEVEAVVGFWGKADDGEMRKALDAAGLKCSSVQQGPDRLRNEFDRVVSESKSLGVQYVVCGYISGAFQKTPLAINAFHKAAVEFNQWAGKLREQGLRFAYHNHDYEFRPYDGKPGYDTLLAETEPGLVDFELDVFWVKRGGQDPVDYLKRHSRRMRLVHLKDMVPGTPVGDFSVGTSEEASTAVGSGILDFPAILRAARQARVERYYVEDESSEAPEGIRKSGEYLRKVRI